MACAPALSPLCTQVSARRAKAPRCAVRGRNQPCVCASSSDGGDAQTRAMGYDQALTVLGVRDGASADAIVAAKRAALSRGASADEVDAAYDAVLMRSFSKRAGGAVDLQVKYADVAKAGTSQKSGGADGVARWLTRNAPAVSAPDSAALALPAALFAAASLAALAQGAAHVPGAPDAAPSLPLALGFGLSVYSLRRKNLSLPRAASLSAAGLLAGTAVGSLVQAALHVDIVPLGPLSSPATLVSEFALAGLFAASAFLV